MALSTPGGSVRTVGLGVAAQLRRRVAGTPTRFAQTSSLALKIAPPRKQKKLLDLSVQELRLSPGGYLLSRDLSSDYHRRADVSLPGSEWDRVGPSGYDHQASVSFLTACPGRHVCLLWGSVFCCCCLLFSLLCRLCFQQADIRVARGFISFLCVLLSLKVIKRFIKGLSPKV